MANPRRSKWQDDPWGGQCTALWQPNGELWLAINPKATDGTRVWKTQNGAANYLLAGEHINALWDNVDQQDFVITDANTITVNGTDHFRSTPAVPVKPVQNGNMIHGVDNVLLFGNQMENSGLQLILLQQMELKFGKQQVEELMLFLMENQLNLFGIIRIINHLLLLIIIQLLFMELIILEEFLLENNLENQNGIF